MTSQLDDAIFGCARSSAVRTIHSAGRVHLLQLVQRLIHERQARNNYFRGELFSEPAWDILLVLFLAETQQQRISIWQVRNRVPLPATTVLRWITNLTDEGVLVRKADPLDRRRKFIELTPETSAAMCAYCWSTAATIRLAA